MKNFYPEIFKRKSFHLFRNLRTKEPYKNSFSITKEEIDDIYKVFKTFSPLVSGIKVDILIAQNEQTTCKRDQEYCILFYSEKKDNYLQNIGFIGEQLDLYLASKNIGALWFGIGKTELQEYNGLDFVTMMAICKVPEDSFRKDMFKSKRKAIEEIWSGNDYLEIANIIRFAPSSCNTQPWKVREITQDGEKKLEVYRYRKEGKRGIMKADRVVYQNLIDIGIFILFLAVVLDEKSCDYTINVFNDNEKNENELTLSAVFNLKEK